MNWKTQENSAFVINDVAQSENIRVLMFLTMASSSSGKVCCVIGCSNNQKNSPGTKFYRFPAIWYKLDQKIKWIQAIKRKK